MKPKLWKWRRVWSGVRSSGGLSAHNTVPQQLSDMVSCRGNPEFLSKGSDSSVHTCMEMIGMCSSNDKRCEHGLGWKERKLCVVTERGIADSSSTSESMLVQEEAELTH